MQTDIPIRLRLEVDHKGRIVLDHYALRFSLAEAAILRDQIDAILARASPVERAVGPTNEQRGRGV